MTQLTKSELHDVIDTLNVSTWTTHALFHAMIDAEILTSLECQREDCLYPGESFSPVKGRGHLLRISIDHVTPKQFGGVNRIENFRIMHVGCNAGWRIGLLGTFHTIETRQKISIALIGHKQSPETRAKRSATLKGRFGNSDAAICGWDTRRKNAQ